MEELKKYILTLSDNEQKERLLKELKTFQKALDSADFRYKRTLMDKEAIKNILNASIVEIEKQKAVIDKQKKEALNRASLDRFRVEISSMRNTKDLEKITPLLWEELTLLNIPFSRSGIILIHAEEDKKIEIYLTTPEGKSIASFQIQAYQTAFSQKIFDYWNQQIILKEQWNEANFLDWANSLMQLNLIASSEDYIQKESRQNMYLHFLPFTQGMLYIGSPDPLKEDEMLLLQELTIAFSTAYDRYDDFKKLEEAKKQIEKTLDELRATQNQLIQSEKMASLGELTAGIAHEIQNPLNFVNNFSEVNKELILELIEEVDKTDRKEIIEIANNIKDNADKIVHHGRRADAIVKGMLQHSRRSNGTKEKTDINALADEYLRLAYHGLRAKEKSFNAKMITHYDENLQQIFVVPQDIGRVILNLITNAFYVIDKKSKQSDTTYEPTVTLSTRNLNDRVEIVVSDNGSGIPRENLEKIFQPFFTTKPTGQGTGLGLSLSYDIVKAHGGELSVESKENEYTRFILNLPVQ